MFLEGEVVYSTDRNVPGTHIRLEFTLLVADKRFLAVLNAFRGDNPPLSHERLFDHLPKGPIQKWTASLAGSIGRQFGTEFQSILRSELERIMEVPDVAPVQTSEATVAPRKLTPLDFMTETDIWEPDVASELPRSDIVSMVVVRRTKFGISCLLNVTFGNSLPVDLPTAAQNVDQIVDWLGSYDTGQNVASRLGMQDSDALGLCKRWHEVFAKPLKRWETLPPWFSAKTPPPQTHIVDGHYVQLP